MITLSDGLPLQWWLTGVPTFNESLEAGVDGIDGYCYHQKVACDQSLYTGFKEKGIVGFNDYTIKAFNKAGEVIETIPLVRSSVSTMSLQMPGSNSGTGEEWTETIDGPQALVSKDEVSKKYLIPIINGQAGFDLHATIGFQLDFLGIGPPPSSADYEIKLRVGFYNADLSLHASVVAYTKDDDEIGTINLNTGVTAWVPAYLSVSVDNTSDDSGRYAALLITSAEVTNSLTNSVYTLSFLPNDYGFCDSTIQFKIFKVGTPDVEIARTDYIDISSTISLHTQIFYKGLKDYDGIPYDDSSGYTSIMVPGIFYHNRDLTVQKILKLTNRNVTSSFELTKKTLLDILNMPDYMHTKTQIVLSHCVVGSVQIKGLEWEIGDDYEQASDLPESYPQSPAKILLTRKNYQVRNVI